MRVAIVRMTPELLDVTFAARPTVVISSDWPEDAKVRNMHWDHDRRQVLLLVESSQFDDIPEGAIAPEWNPTFVARDIPRSLMTMFENMDKGA